MRRSAISFSPDRFPYLDRPTMKNHTIAMRENLVGSPGFEPGTYAV